MKKSTKTIASLAVIAALGSMLTVSIASACDDAGTKGKMLGDYQHLHEGTGDRQLNFEEMRGDREGERGGEHEGAAEFREAMQSAMESGDYDAFVTVLEGAEHPKASHLLENVTEDNFSLIIELHEAKENQDHETAKEILDELGFEGRGFRGGMQK